MCQRLGDDHAGIVLAFELFVHIGTLDDDVGAAAAGALLRALAFHRSGSAGVQEVQAGLADFSVELLALGFQRVKLAGFVFVHVADFQQLRHAGCLLVALFAQFL